MNEVTVPTGITKYLVTVRQLVQVCPALTEGGVRALIFNADRNGLAPCLVRVGRRVLIDLIEFEDWLDSQRGGAS